MQVGASDAVSTAFGAVETARQRFMKEMVVGLGGEITNIWLVDRDFKNNKLLWARKKVELVGAHDADGDGAAVETDSGGGGGGSGIFTPRDRHGKQIATAVSTAALERCHSEYLAACEAAREAAQEELQWLCGELGQTEMLQACVAAVKLNVVFLAASEHASEALRRNWSLPELEPASSALDTTHRPRLQLAQLRPYWLDWHEAVPNDVDLTGQWLLTGPNMAGKSTVLRAVTAAALLANCGLAAPVAATARCTTQPTAKCARKGLFIHVLVVGPGR